MAKIADPENWNITTTASTTGGPFTPLTTDGCTVAYPFPYDNVTTPVVDPFESIRIPNSISGTLTFNNSKKMVKFVKLVVLKEVRNLQDDIVDYNFVTEQVIKVGPKTKELQFAIMKQIEGFDPETMIYQEVWTVQRDVE